MAVCVEDTSLFGSCFQQQIAALKAPSGELAFLAGHVDTAHVGFSGHSVGGCTVAAQAGANGAQVVIPLSSAAPITAGGMLKSAMFISGMSDTVDGNNAIQVLHNHHWCGVDSVAIVGLPTLFDCGANNFVWQVGVKDVAYASTAALEETLTCRPERATTITNMKTAQSTIGDFKETK